MFTKINTEGFISEFYIQSNCKMNLELASHIMLRLMTFQEWEVQTPESERGL